MGDWKIGSLRGTVALLVLRCNGGTPPPAYSTLVKDSGREGQKHAAASKQLDSVLQYRLVNRNSKTKQQKYRPENWEIYKSYRDTGRIQERRIWYKEIH